MTTTRRFLIVVKATQASETRAMPSQDFPIGHSGLETTAIYQWITRS
jgi:hypothetical protein